MHTRTHVLVRCDGRDYEVPYGTSAGDALAYPGHVAAHPPLAAIVHNRCVDLSFPITMDGEIRAVDYTMRLGVLVYRRTVTLILLEAVRQLFGPTRVKIDQAIGNGYFYRIETPAGFTAEEAAALEARMRAIIDEDIPLVTKTVTLAEARQIFAERGAKSVELLLKTSWETYVTIVYCGEFCTLHHFPVAPRTGLIGAFELIHEPHGAILRFPPRGKNQLKEPFVEPPKLVDVYRETARWLKLLRVQTVGDLNAVTIGGGAGELIRVAEGLHEKKIAQIADQIMQAAEPVRLVLIAGPSASGKTTFSKRLGLQLRVNGIRPVTLSTDDFYVDRHDTPRDEAGDYDFEGIEAIDLALFNELLAAILRGENVLTPRFDFVTGQRKPRDKWVPLQLEPGQVLVVEGIHGLNPRLTEAVPRQQKFHIYANALTQLCVDNHHRIYTSDSRLIRRIVRDRMFRNYSTASTIERWPSVRQGELRNIFPYQDQADVIFNSALPYEHSVLRLYAERFLLEVPEEHPSFVEAFRLLRFISSFVPIFDERIPQISILREFLGGSYFSY